ncbi:hypothetical protein OIU34_03275 [Pararhizobium sp. BT-229]|uniref:hypothetical protein n=1 Tax=Pararhizobium sp. BT-229 TaxID=2986923 RepID=UPI0021F6EAD4|nr:hypothetical protein [Pararhizobium sp. BT-229]MCV9960912.1 hypothetical protein [Pararhizobium sp. BT-229]
MSVAEKIRIRTPLPITGGLSVGAGYDPCRHRCHVVRKDDINLHAMWDATPAICRWLDAICAIEAFAKIYYHGSLLTEKYPHLKVTEKSPDLDNLKIDVADIPVKASLGHMPHAVRPRTPGRDFGGIVREGPASMVGMEVWGGGGELTPS